jgi:RNA polymerase sigma-70 factor (ECF subfamily)
MLQVKAGDTQKLGLLYERYKKWVFNFLYQMNGDRALTEDLVQNVFMRILKYKQSYTEESTFVTWMFQIARNLNHDAYRLSTKKETIDLDGVSYKMKVAETIDTQIEKSENHALLYKALDRLPYEKKEIIVLSKLKDLKYKEIGQMIGCSEVAARTKAHRALQDLRNTFLALEKQ